MPEFIHVNSEETLKKLNSNKEDKLVKYYMDGCSHCDDLEPIWKLVESRIKKDHDDSNIIIVQLNANFMENADVPNVEGFPTISMIKGGRKIEHKGARTEESIMDFYKKNNLLTSQSGGGRHRRKTKRKGKSISKKNKRKGKSKKKKRKSKHKRSKKGKGPVMSKVKGLMPAKKVQPQSAVFSEVKQSDDNYEEAQLNRRGHELVNEMRNPRSPWTQAAAEQEFNQNKIIYERKFKNVPVAEVVEENPETLGTRPVSNIYYNPKTNDGHGDNNVVAVVSSRRRRGRNTNRVVPITGGKRKKTKSRKKARKWSKKYKKSINCRRPKGFSQKQYCKYGRKKK